MQEHFNTYLENQVKKYGGISFPVKSGVFMRAFVKRAKTTDLHPNPDDEFIKPGVGPSYRIISEYEEKLRTASLGAYNPFADPIIVEKMHPDGYMIVNGHHRWAAFYRQGWKRVPVQVVNLTHMDDVIKMLENASSNKRVTLDLDEVVFGSTNEDEVEKRPTMHFGLIHKERIKKGIPALFNFFSLKGYDIWVYTANLYSIEYIRSYMKKYHVNVTGIITGTGRNAGFGDSANSKIASLMAGQYKYTLHIDNDMLVITNSETKEFTDYEIKTEKTNWSQAIMDIVGKLNLE